VWLGHVLNIQVWVVQVHAQNGSIQGVEIGITDCEYSARRRGIRHLYAHLTGTEVNTDAAKTCLEHLVNNVLTDSLIIEPPSKNRCTSASHMIQNNVVEAVPYMSLAACYVLENLDDLVPLSNVQESPKGGWSMTSPVEEVEVPTVVVQSPTSDTEVVRSGGSTTSDTDTDPMALPLAAGSANQSATAQHCHDILNVHPMGICPAQTPEEFAFLESEAWFGKTTQACFHSSSVSGSECFVPHRLRECSLVSACAQPTELEVQA
jgi:hypothetical protein